MAAEENTTAPEVSQVDEIEGRVQRLERQIDVLRYPVVREGQVLPAVGFIADFASELEDPDAVERSRRDFLPLPDLENREGYGHSPARYWLSGLEDYDKVAAAGAHHGVERGRYFDFGGSTGRLFRHVYCQSRMFEVWTSDFKAASFRWNQLHMPTDLRVFLNGFAPPLPVPDFHFDVVTALSVFTHIDELESAWLMELRRITRPGGLVYATFHDEAQWELKSEVVLRAIAMSPNGADVTGETPFPAERTAYHYTDGSYYGCNVFHPTEYIRREWGRYFEVLEIRPRDHWAQAVVLLTPR